MPFKSQAQRRKFAELLVKGEISPETFEEWSRETGSAELPERVAKKARGKRSVKKRSAAKKGRKSAPSKKSAGKAPKKHTAKTASRKRTGGKRSRAVKKRSTRKK
jgi:hypothetical protein